MSLDRPALSDALRPSEPMALQAWAARVRAHQEQIERCREIDDPADFYSPFARRFAFDPARADDPTLEVLRSMVRPDDVWLDIGAGGGRYALPIAAMVRTVIAVEPSPSMRDILHAGMQALRVHNVEIHDAQWPPTGVETYRADVALMANVGSATMAIGSFLEAAEAAASRACVAVLSVGDTSLGAVLWRPIHGEDRMPLPRLPELLTLLLARGRLPAVTLVSRPPATFEAIEDLLAMARRQLWVRPGSAKDERLRSLVTSAATSGARGWALDRSGSRVGIVTWATDETT